MKPTTAELSNLAQLAANWTKRKYGRRDAIYMLTETFEVQEGYLAGLKLTVAQEREVIQKATKILNKAR